MAWVSAALAVGSAAASFLGGRAASNAQEEAARRVAEAYNIPFWGPGEKVTKQAAMWLASKYNGGPVNAMPTIMALASGPLGDALAPVSERAATPLAAPQAQAFRSGFDVAGKKFNADLGRNYGNLTADALVAQQGAKTQFHNWQNSGYLNALQGAGAPNSGLDLLVPTVYQLGRLGYQWMQNRDQAMADNANAQLATAAERGGDYAIMPWRTYP